MLRLVTPLHMTMSDHQIGWAAVAATFTRGRTDLLFKTKASQEISSPSILGCRFVVPKIFAVTTSTLKTVAKLYKSNCHFFYTICHFD